MFKDKKKQEEPKPKEEWTAEDLKRDVWTNTLKQAKKGLAETMQALEYQQTMIAIAENKLASLDIEKDE